MVRGHEASKLPELDDRPVFKIHGMDYFYRQTGNDRNRVVAQLSSLRL